MVLQADLFLELEKALGKLEPDTMRRLTYPLLGNAIQVCFEYVNGRMERDEFLRFEEALEKGGLAFGLEHTRKEEDWYLEWPPFFVPSRFVSPDDEDAPTVVEGFQVLADWARIVDRHEFLPGLASSHASRK